MGEINPLPTKTEHKYRVLRDEAINKAERERLRLLRQTEEDKRREEKRLKKESYFNRILDRINGCGDDA